MKKVPRKWGILLLISLLGMVMFIVQQVNKQPEAEDPSSVQVDAENLLETVESLPINEVRNIPESFMSANQTFSLELFKSFMAEENVVFSPTSVYISLALIANGATAEARQEILETLNLQDLTIEQTNSYFHGLIKILEEKEDNTNLQIANSIWVDLDFQANNDFLQVNQTYYDAATYRTDFSDPNTPNDMNHWISEVTNGNIQELVDTIRSETVMNLFSTIYFDGKWDMPFEAEDTYESEFFVGEESVLVEKMTARLPVFNLKTAEEEGVLLPYDDGKYSFLAVMPNQANTVREYLAALNQEKLQAIFKNVKQNEIDLLLPKFKVRFQETLNDSLSAMGITSVFNPNQNSLKNMGEVNGQLYISEMRQQTFIEVNELGTEAASAVNSTIDVTSMPEPRPVFDFNRPFVYAIINNRTRLPIVLGIMDHPNK